MTDTSKIKLMIDRALADGRLSRKEMDDIKAAIAADGKVTEEEYKLFRELQEMVWTAAIIMED